MRRTLLTSVALASLTACSSAGTGEQSAHDTDAGVADSGTSTGGSAGVATGGTSGSGGAGTGGTSTSTGGNGGSAGAPANDGAAGGCTDANCLCTAFETCEPSEFTRATGQDGTFVDRICGTMDGGCIVVSYIQYPESARIWRCSFPPDAPCNTDGSGLSVSASPYCSSMTCSASGTPCADAFFECP